MNLYDAKGALRARIDEDQNKKQIFDKTGRFMGFYDKRTDTTHDKTGRLFGRGEQLALLLEN
jgi:hypothetical protein